MNGHASWLSFAAVTWPRGLAERVGSLDGSVRSRGFGQRLDNFCKTGDKSG
jgi:hypothetical protein